MSGPEVSIVIVSWNVRDLLVSCLTSIQRFVQTPYEVLVVDNHSSDGTVEALQRDFPNVKIIVNAENAGFARANNQGWEQAQGRYICFLNPDTECINDPFPVVVEYFQNNPKVGCVGPEILNPNRTHQQSVRRFPGFLDQLLVLLKIPGALSWLYLTSLYRVVPPLAKYFTDSSAMLNKPTSVDQVMGAVMIIPRTVMEDAGTFDEGYWIWFEEVDLCRRLHQRGYAVVYLPTAKVVHHGGQSFNQHLSLAKHVWLLKSLARYTRKFWSPVPRYALYVIMPISYILTVLQSFFKPR